MLNLHEILQNAQGGKALDNLASEFGITRDEADSAVRAIVPALSEAIRKRTAEPAAASSFLGILSEGRFLAAFSEPAAAQEKAESSSEALRQILGSTQAREAIVLQAASASGIGQDILEKMLPVIASMIFGGLTKSLESQGFGGILAELSKSARKGGLEGMLGQILGGHPAPPPPPPPAPAPAGGLGSILGSLFGKGKAAAGPAAGGGTQPSAAGAGGLGGLLGAILGQFGLGPKPAASPPPEAAPPGGSPGLPGLDLDSIKASLEALTKMLEPGTPPPKPETPPQSAPAAETAEEKGGIAEEGSNIIAEIDRIIGEAGGKSS
ncbi:MAG TPA: DUF937 domain-containing protein [Methylocella sp.]|nr:DUF937 domain-containing protein [Methylocella sp.]